MTTTGASYAIPEGFDAAQHLGGEAWEIGEETTSVKLRFDASIAWWAEQNLPDAKATENDDGSRDVTMDVANLDALISWVIGFGDKIEITAPDDARVRLVDHLAPFVT